MSTIQKTGESYHFDSWLHYSEDSRFRQIQNLQVSQKQKKGFNQVVRKFHLNSSGIQVVAFVSLNHWPETEPLPGIHGFFGASVQGIHARGFQRSDEAEGRRPSLGKGRPVGLRKPRKPRSMDTSGNLQFEEETTRLLLMEEGDAEKSISDIHESLIGTHFPIIAKRVGGNIFLLLMEEILYLGCTKKEV